MTLIGGFRNLLPHDTKPLDLILMAENGYWLCYWTLPGRDLNYLSDPSGQVQFDYFSQMYQGWPECHQLMAEIGKLARFAGNSAVVARQSGLIFAAVFFESLKDNQNLTLSTRSHVLEICSKIKYLIDRELFNNEERRHLEMLMLAMSQVLQCRMFALKCLVHRYDSTENRAYYLIRPAIDQIVKHFQITGRKTCTCNGSTNNTCECLIRWCTYKILQFHTDFDLHQIWTGKQIDEVAPFSENSTFKSE